MFNYVIHRQKEAKNVMYLRLHREMSIIIITVDQFGKAYCIYNSSHYFKQKESPFEMIIALKNHMPKLSCKLNGERWRQSSDFECFVVNNKYTAVTNGFKLK